MLASWIPKVAKGWKLSTNCRKKLRPSYDIWYNCHITQQFCFKCRKSDGKPTWTKWLAVLWSQLVATKDPINIYPSTNRGNLEQWSQASQVPIWFAYWFGYLTILPGSAAGAAALKYIYIITYTYIYIYLLSCIDQICTYWQINFTQVIKRKTSAKSMWTETAWKQ